MARQTLVGQHTDGLRYTERQQQSVGVVGASNEIDVDTNERYRSEAEAVSYFTMTTVVVL